MAQRSPTRVQQSAPAEVLASLNLGINGYTDPTLCNPRQWSGARNVYSGAFGFVQRARFANILTASSNSVATISNAAWSSANITVSGVTYNSVLFTTAVAHGFTAGSQVAVTGVNPSGYNGTAWIFSVPSPTTFVAISTQLTTPGAYINGGSATAGYLAQGTAFTTFKYFALPGLSSYLIADNNNKLFSFDSGASYAPTQRVNPYIDVFGAGNSKLAGPWSREALQNILYEMNGQVKQAGRGANAATVEGFGLDAPDTSPQVVISAGSSQTITNIQRSNGTVTVTLGAALTVPGGNGIGMVNVAITAGDTSFSGTFLLLTGSGTTTLTWTQFGQNTALLTPTGTVNVSITQSVGRSYAYAWENANKNHVSAPSPVTQFIQYNVQNGAIQLVQQGTISFSGGPTNVTVTGVGTAFTSAWVGRYLWTGQNAFLQISAVASATSMTIQFVDGGSATVNGIQFQVFDPQSTHVRLYETADGGATYFRTQRNTFSPLLPLATAGLQFFDNANSEPPSFPFTTEISQLFNVPPPVGSFIKEYQQRLLIFGGTIPGQTFFYSNIESTSIGLTQESFAPLNQVTLPIQNANISGMADLPGSLIIWSDKQDMFRLTGLLADNTPLGLQATNTAVGLGTTITSLPYNIGCANPFAVAVTPLGAIWVSSNRELWLYTDRYAPRNIGRPVQNILRNIPLNQLANIRLTYYHSLDRNWVAIALSNGASNNVLVNLDLDLLASNGQPSFFVFDMATNHPAFWVFNINCAALEVVYETGGAVRLLVGSTDLIQDADYQTGLFGAEVSVSNAFLNTHAWGNDTAFIIKRPNWFRFTTNQDPSQLALQGWSFAALGIDDDFYTFASPLVLTLTPGVNDTSSLCGNPNLNLGEAFRHSPELFRVGGVNFVMGRRIEFVVNFPSGTGVNYALRSIQVGFGASPPR